MSLSEQEVVRREALSELRSLGIDPFPPQEFKVNALSAEIKSNRCTIGGTNNVNERQRESGIRRVTG